jgi:streptogramin lyase
MFAPAIFAQTSPPQLVPSFIDWVAGTPGVSGHAPDAGQPAIAARGYGGSSTALVSAARWGIADGEGNIYIGDTGNLLIRKVDAADGLIYVVIPPFSSMGQARGGAIDQFGDLILGDETKSKVWIWNPVNSAQPVSLGGGANKQSGCTGDGGLATGGQMDNDSDVTVDRNGNVYVADNNCNAIRKIDTSGIITTVVGGALMGNGGGAAGSCINNGTVCPASLPAGQCTGFNALVNNPYGVAVDPDGNVYVANPATNGHSPTPGCFDVIKVLVDPTTCSSSLPAGTPCTAANGGSVTANSQVVLLAGTGTSSSSSDPGGGETEDPDGNTTQFGLATAINLKPQALGIDPRRNPPDSVNEFNVLIGESSHIWLYDGATGYMRRIAGGAGSVTAGSPPSGGWVCGNTWPLPDHSCANSIGGYCYAWPTPPWDIFGDGCIATEAVLSNNYGNAMDAEGNVLVGDDGHNIIRKISTGAQFDARPSPTNPGNVPLTQNLYVHFGVSDEPAESNAFVIPAGTDFSIPEILTISGNQYYNPLCGVTQTGMQDQDPNTGAPAATNPDGTQDCLLAVTFTPSRPGKVHAPLTITSDFGLVTTVDLTGIVAQPSITWDPANVSILATSVKNPEGIALDQDGNWYVADTNNNTVWKVSQSGATDLADSSNGGLKGPLGVAVDGAQNVYIADTGNNVIKRVDGVTGAVTVFAGGGTPCPLPPLVNSPMLFPYPPAPPDAIGNNCPATQATLNAPSGVAVDPQGDVYIADTGNNEIRRVEAMTGFISLAAGGSTADCLSSSPCSPQLAVLNAPAAVAADVWGNFYIADTGNARILQVSADGGLPLDSVNCSGLSVPCPVGNLTSVVASGVAAKGIAADSAGDLYYAATAADTVAMVNLTQPADPTNNPNGSAPKSPVAVYNKTADNIIGMTGVAGSIGANGGSASSFLLNGPTGLAVDPYGSVYVADSGNNRILWVNRQSAATPAVAMNFGALDWGQTAVSPLTTLGNAGDLGGSLNWPFPITNLPPVVTPGSFSPPSAAVFSLNSTNCTTTMNSGGVCAFTAEFSPGSEPAGYSDSTEVAFESTIQPTITSSAGENTTSLTLTGAAPVILAFTLSCPTVTYDGGPHSCTGSATLGGSPLSGTWSFSPASETEGGTYTVTGTFTSTDPRYTGTGTASGTLTINPAAPVLTLDCPTFAYYGAPNNPVYNGNPYSCTGSATGVGGAAVAGSFTFDPASEINAGTYPVTGTFTSSDPNYTGGTAAGAMTIFQAAAYLVMNCPNVTYDGNPHSCTGAAWGVGHTAVSGVWTVNPPSATDAGLTYVMGEFASSDPNYLGGAVGYDWTIYPTVPVLTISCPEVTYDGNPHGCTGSATGLGGVALGGRFSFSPESETEAGSYPMSATFFPTDTNYGYIDFGSGTLNIDAAVPQVLVFCSSGITYDGNVHSCRALATGLGSVSVPGSFAWSPAQGETNAGTYSLTATFTSANPDYAGGSGTGTLTIPPATPQVIVSCDIYAYDGNPHGCSAAAVGLNGAGVNGSFTFSPQSETAAGSYTITATFTSADPNYGTGKGTGTLIINPPSAPVLAINPASLVLTFSTQLIGTSSVAQYVALTNTGRVALAVGPAAVSGPFAISNQAGTCTTAMNLAAGRTCVIRVVFTPTANGPASGSVVIDSAGAPNGSYTVALSGAGQGETAVATLSAASVTFSNPQLLGTSSSAQYLQIASMGSASLVVTGVTLGGANPGDFLVSNQAGTCTTGATLVYDAKCNLRIVFAPTAAGTRTATLYIADNAGGSPQQVLLSGTGQAAAAVFQSSTTGLNFNPEPVGFTTVAQYITLRNAGTATLIVYSAVLGGSNPGDFKLTNQAGTCTTGMTMGPWVGCNLRVTFAPTATGARSATVIITDNAGGHTVALSGTGE